MSNNHDPDKTIEDFFNKIKSRSENSEFNLSAKPDPNQFINFRSENNKYLRKLYYETGAKPTQSKDYEPPVRRLY